jgi:hypothetical protein
LLAKVHSETVEEEEMVPMLVELAEVMVVVVDVVVMLIHGV